MIVKNLIESVISKDKSKEELCYLAFVDSLTKTYNRNMLEEFRKEFDSMDIFVTIIDIDNLKMINDTKGHEEGDIYLLEALLRRLMSVRIGYLDLEEMSFLLLINQKLYLICLDCPMELCLSRQICL